MILILINIVLLLVINGNCGIDIDLLIKDLLLLSDM